MALAGAPLAGYDTSREAFIGPYRAYHNPLAVEKGQCSNSNAFGDNACGSLQTDLTLQPGESRDTAGHAGHRGGPHGRQTHLRPNSVRSSGPKPNFRN